jgi:dsRNA-specific ribonuclease
MVSHIYHFCARLPRDAYVDLDPKFIFEEDPGTKLITATILLPNCLEPSLRSTTGVGQWRTEKAAEKDAASQAYIALYRAGLLNDHLLPLLHTWEAEEKEQEKQIRAIVTVAKQYRPWDELAGAWSSPDLHQTLLKVRPLNSKDGRLDIMLVSPAKIPDLSPLDLYWNEHTRFRIESEPCCRANFANTETTGILRSITKLLSRSTHSDRATDDRDDFITLFGPNQRELQLLPWLQDNHLRLPADAVYRAERKPQGFVRSLSHYSEPCVFDRWAVTSLPGQDRIIEVECTALQNRRHFWDPGEDSVKDDVPQGTRKLKSFPIDDCVIDALPFDYARFNLFVPAILLRLEVAMVVERLQTSILHAVPIKDAMLVAAAISAPSAGLPTHYQRLEFIGDAVLKFVVSQQLFSQEASWHEGYLSKRRDGIISNTRLAKAALDSCLDQYIITECIKVRKWHPLFVAEAGQDTRPARSLSTKVLADVVEALIGAAFVDGGLSSARLCIHAFLPNVNVSPPAFPYHDTAVPDSPALADAERIIGRQFRNRAVMLEALTHPSYNADLQRASYQRLEYLGDAVLDMLVVSAMAAQPQRPAGRQLTQADMTSIKAALVNANFLGYLCLDLHAPRAEPAVVGAKRARDGTILVRYAEPAAGGGAGRDPATALWGQLRHSSPALPDALRTCLARHAALRDEIAAALAAGPRHPWRALARLQPDKFLSDAVESVAGAIFVDGGADLGACRAFAERIGLAAYLERVLAGEVDVVHPRRRLDTLAGGSQAVEYVASELEVDGEKRFGCEIKVNGVALAELTGCLTKDEALLGAAAEAADKMKLKVAVR